MSKLELDIRNKLQQIRNQIAAGEDSVILVWVIPDKLACSQRPLRDHPKFGGRMPIPPEARPLVINWVKHVKDRGIRSIICLLENRQLTRYYSGLSLPGGGLLGYYESQGFRVRHFPMTDYQRPKQSYTREVLEAFNEMPKPVLLHCSAAIDRSTPVAAFIAHHHGVTEILS